VAAAHGTCLPATTGQGRAWGGGATRSPTRTTPLEGWGHQATPPSSCTLPPCTRAAPPQQQACMAVRRCMGWLAGGGRRPMGWGWGGEGCRQVGWVQRGRLGAWPALVVGAGWVGWPPWLGRPALSSCP
jgi:hypothetical protein